jgi:hypothetical protein
MKDTNAYKGWTEQEILRAAEIWQREYAAHWGEGEGPLGSKSAVCAKIAAALDRSFGSVQARYHARGPSFHTKVRNSTRAPVPVVTSPAIERQRRLDARDRLSLTGLRFGDPPPGFSALDGMTGMTR